MDNWFLNVSSASLIDSSLGSEYSGTQFSCARESWVLVHEVFQLRIRTGAKLHWMTIGAASRRTEMSLGLTTRSTLSTHREHWELIHPDWDRSVVLLWRGNHLDVILDPDGTWNWTHWGRGPMETGVYMLGTFQALSQSSSDVPTRYISFTFQM